MSKWITYFFFSVFFLLVQVSCGNVDKMPDKYFVVKVAVSGLELTDSATLLVYETDYDRLRLLNEVALVKGTASFVGQIDAPKIALLRLNHAENPLYFILESCTTEISINKQSIVITGGTLNHDYYVHYRLRNKILQAIENNKSTYAKMVADSSMTHKLERIFVKRDSLLKDSVQSMTLRLVNRNDVVGVLFKDRFINTIDSARMKELRR